MAGADKGFACFVFLYLLNQHHTGCKEIEPEGTKDEDITSRTLKDACVFEMHDVVETKTKMIGGKEKTYQERTPISTYAISQAEPDPEP